MFMNSYFEYKYNIILVKTDEGYHLHDMESFIGQVNNNSKKIKSIYFSITDFYRNVLRDFSVNDLKHETIIYSDWENKDGFLFPNKDYKNKFSKIHKGHAKANKKLDSKSLKGSNAFILLNSLIYSDKEKGIILNKIKSLIVHLKKTYDNVYVKLHPRDDLDLNKFGIKSKNIFNNKIPAEEAFAIHNPNLIVGPNSLSCFKAKSMYNCELIGFFSSETTANQNAFEHISDKYYHSLIDLCDDILSDKPLISIIMLTYNALGFTKKCIKSIFQNTKCSYEIIFVDNASSDGTVEYLNSLINNTNHKLIINKKNLGFSKGNNIGVKFATGKYIMLLNNDTLVPLGWEKAY